MPRFAGRSFNISARVDFKSRGRSSQSANTLIQNVASQKEAQAQRALQRSAAFARGVIRRGMRKGRTRYVQVKGKNGKTKRGHTKRMRIPSRPGSPPNYHSSGNSFGLKWVRFERMDRYSYRVGPEYRRTKGAWRSKFRIDRMLEKGGTGRILAPTQLPDTDAGWSVFNRVKNHGEKWPSTFVAARYPKRPYVSVAVDPVRREFPKIYTSVRR